MHRSSAVIIATAIACSVSLVRSTPAAAQVGGIGGANKPYAAPYQPRLSPYLDLLRADNSVLSPYHTFVEPRRQFRQSLNRQAVQIGKLQQQVYGRSTGRSATSTSRLPTGRGASFNNYLHFYPMTRPARSQ